MHTTLKLEDSRHPPCIMKQFHMYMCTDNASMCSAIPAEVKAAIAPPWHLLQGMGQGNHQIIDPGATFAARPWLGIDISRAWPGSCSSEGQTIAQVSSVNSIKAKLAHYAHV